MGNDLNSSDITLIVRNLIAFIVVEGKEYVHDDFKQEYVLGYILVLAKTIYLIDEQEDFSLVEDIANDISKYLK